MVLRHAILNGGRGGILSEKRRRRAAQAPGGTGGRVPHFPRLEPKFCLCLSLSLSLLGLRDGQVPRAPCPPNVLLGEGVSLSLCFALLWGKRGSLCLSLSLSLSLAAAVLGPFQDLL